MEPEEELGDRGGRETVVEEELAASKLVAAASASAAVAFSRGVDFPRKSVSFFFFFPEQRKIKVRVRW